MYRPYSLSGEDYTGVNEWEDIQRILSVIFDLTVYFSP